MRQETRGNPVRNRSELEGRKLAALNETSSPAHKKPLAQTLENARGAIAPERCRTNLNAADAPGGSYVVAGVAWGK